MVRRQKEHLFTEVDEECRTTEYPIPAKRVVHEVSSVFGDGTVLVNENGSQDSWSYFYPYYTVGDDSACVTVAEQTCMGVVLGGRRGAGRPLPRVARCVAEHAGFGQSGSAGCDAARTG
jgi:acetolactate synthase-1/2/3 large subunit